MVMQRSEVAPIRASRLSALEAPTFPFAELSEIAEAESWRKEIHRPIYHTHKWWAQRLGSVFRAILIAAFSDPDRDVVRAFYEPTRLEGVVFDPFMGSGTTVGEALKLGLRAIGRDINPVAHFIVKAALSEHPRTAIEAEYTAIEREVAEELRALYRSQGPHGELADVLYYFWVKVVACPACRSDVDLFPSYIFARNAYVKRRPLSRVVCPGCGLVSEYVYGSGPMTCDGCSSRFDPANGPANGSSARCTACAHEFKIIDAVRRLDDPPRHRMYAKLMLLPDGSKAYGQTDDSDLSLYETALRQLAERKDAYPIVALAHGYNTKQVLNYNYKYWHQMFNGRQLLALSILGERIGRIADDSVRALFITLFSGTLEFNNMFASYKGEGTGAVRHMFAHHILKPERTPLEANVWGTPKSSGAFSTLFKSRMLRALDYAEQPFEIRPGRKEGKAFGLSMPMSAQPAMSWSDFVDGRRLYLSCGDSSSTDLPAGSVDAVVTDPPFFDNVHYSELADFFYVWQRHIQGLGAPGDTTRRPEEVQSTSAEDFSDRLAAVFAESARVLVPAGQLIFTYHHSRSDGWTALIKATSAAGVYVTAVQPIKSEMSVATPKSQATEPIDLDMIIVCRKRDQTRRLETDDAAIMGEAVDATRRQLQAFHRVGRRPGSGDVRVILNAHALRCLSTLELTAALEWYGNNESMLESAAHDLAREPAPAVSRTLTLFEDGT
jgi:putative DNA methylase